MFFRNVIIIWPSSYHHGRCRHCRHRPLSSVTICTVGTMPDRNPDRHPDPHHTHTFRPRRSSTPNPRHHPESTHVPWRSSLRREGSNRSLCTSKIDAIYFAFAPENGFFFDGPEGCK